MKKVEALMAAHQLDAVIEVLRSHSVEEMVISEVLESGPGRARLYRGVKYAVDFAAEIKLETVVGDELASSTVHFVAEALRSTSVASAGISVTPVEAVIEIGDPDHARVLWDAAAPSLAEARCGV